MNKYDASIDVYRATGRELYKPLSCTEIAALDSAVDDLLITGASRFNFSHVTDETGVLCRYEAADLDAVSDLHGHIVPIERTVVIDTEQNQGRAVCEQTTVRLSEYASINGASIAKVPQDIGGDSLYAVYERFATSSFTEEYCLTYMADGTREATIKQIDVTAPETDWVKRPMLKYDEQQLLAQLQKIAATITR